MNDEGERLYLIAGKVITALEHLERLAADRDAEEEASERLRATVEHMEREGAKRVEERHRADRVNGPSFGCITYSNNVCILLR